MKTEISTDRAAAVELLRKGEIVALPTETVYGLAAEALNAIAVARIFEAKERPRFDPLIVHLPEYEWLERIADVSTHKRKLLSALASSFWPGPLTIVLPKRPLVPDIVTAGLETVAVRISGHPVFAEVIQDVGQPLAAPSANRFGRVSPTTARHVLDELGGRIPFILDAGPTQHGIESTIVAVAGDKIRILRRGPITAEQLADLAQVEIAPPSREISAPGQLASHYAPKTPLKLVEHAKSFVTKQNRRVALLAWNPVDKDSRFVAVRNLSEAQDLCEAAANLFRFLRELDALDVDLIVAERVPDRGIGAAILDRLQRASHRRSGAPGRLE